MTTTTVYAENVKAERNADGDLVVVGKATGPDLDLDKQICDPEWLGKAMPEWFSSGGNVREQHSSIAAGVATELENVADSILRGALARLFREEKDPIAVIKWKEIYETLEMATDRCEDVANIIEGVVLENS